MTVGQRIRDARRRRGVTQKQLADMVGCSQQTIVDIESQDRPQSRFLSPIVRALGESLEWIEEGIGGPAGAVQAEDGALPHYGLDVAGLRALDPSLVDHAVDAVYHPPIDMTRGAFTVSVDAITAAMMPSLAEGSVLFVDPGAPPYLGRMVLVMMPGWHRAEVRILATAAGQHFLETETEAYGPRLQPCVVYRSAEEYKADDGDGAPPALIVGTVVFVGREA